MFDSIISIDGAIYFLAWNSDAKTWQYIGAGPWPSHFFSVYETAGSKIAA